MKEIFPWFPILQSENSSAHGWLLLMQIRFKNAILLGSSGTKSIVNKAETCFKQECSAQIQLLQMLFMGSLTN